MSILNDSLAKPRTEDLFESDQFLAQTYWCLACADEHFGRIK